MTEITFAFEGVSHAEAGRLAQQMQRQFARDGVDPEHLDLVREDAETQNLNDAVCWLCTNWTEAATYAAASVELVAMAKAVVELVGKSGAVVRVKTPRGEIRISPGEADWERIRAYLVDVLNDDHP